MAQDKESSEILRPVGDVLPNCRLIPLADGEVWQGVLMMIKTVGGDGSPSWAVRRAGEMSDHELLGMALMQVELLKERVSRDEH